MFFQPDPDYEAEAEPPPFLEPQQSHKGLSSPYERVSFIPPQELQPAESILLLREVPQSPSELVPPPPRMASQYHDKNPLLPDSRGKNTKWFFLTPQKDNFGMSAQKFKEPDWEYPALFTQERNEDDDFEFPSPPPRETIQNDFEFSSPPPRETTQNDFEFSSPPPRETNEGNNEFSSPPPRETNEGNNEFSSPPPRETNEDNDEFSSPPPRETNEGNNEFSSPPPRETIQNDFEFSSPPPRETIQNDFEFSSPPPRETIQNDFEFSSPPPRETNEDDDEFSSPPPRETTQNDFEFPSPPPRETNEDDDEIPSPPPRETNEDNDEFSSPPPRGTIQNDFEFPSPPPRETNEDDDEIPSPPPRETNEDDDEFSSPPPRGTIQNEDDDEFSSPPPRETNEDNDFEFSSPPPRGTDEDNNEFSSPPPRETNEDNETFLSPQKETRKDEDSQKCESSQILILHDADESSFCELNGDGSTIRIIKLHDNEDDYDYSDDKHGENEEDTSSRVEVKNLNPPEIPIREKIKEVLQERLINGLLKADMKTECFLSKKSGFDFVDFFFVLSAKVVKSIKEKYSLFDKSETEEQKHIFSEIESVLPGDHVSSVTLFMHGDPERTRLTGRHSCFFAYGSHSVLIKMSSGSESRECGAVSGANTFINPTLKYVLADGLGLAKAAEVREYLFNEFDDLGSVVPIWHNMYCQERRLVICYIDGSTKARSLLDTLSTRFHGVYFREVEEDCLVNVFAQDGLCGFSSVADEFGVVHKDECTNCCPRTYDKWHMSSCVHKHSAPPCPNIMDCADDSKRHREEYVHFCRFGSFCTKQNESEHVKSYIHLTPVEKCAECGGLDSGMSGNHYAVCHGCMLPVCNRTHKYSGDDDDETTHKSQYIHPLEDVLFTSYSKPSKSLNVEWMHYEARLEGRIREHFKLVDSDVESENVKDVRAWLESLAPVHKCDLDTLRLIIASGFVLSLDKLNELPNDPVLISECALTQESGREILSGYGSYYDEPKYAAAKQVALSFARKAVDPAYRLSEQEEGAFAYLSKDEASRIQECVNRTHDRISESSMRHRGIKSKCDSKTSTSDTIFASLGPNQSDYGGSKVFIVFNPQVMRHPDFYMSVVGSLCYAKKSTIEKLNVKRPWASGIEEGGYLSCVFRPGHSEGWSVACAMDLIGRAALEKASYGEDPRAAFLGVKLCEVQGLIKEREQPFSIEAHLPGIVSAGLIDRIYLLKGPRDELSFLRGVERKVCYVGDKSKVFDDMAPKVPRLRKAPAGYSFMAHPKHVHAIPAEFSTPKMEPVEISFVACGEMGVMDFAVTLSSSPSQGSSCLTFLCRPFDDAVYVYNFPLSAIAEGYPDLPPPIRVNRYFCKNNWKTGMCCRITLSETTVRLAHGGLSELTNCEELTVDKYDFPDVHSLRYLSFSSMEYATEFKSITIK